MKITNPTLRAHAEAGEEKPQRRFNWKALILLIVFWALYVLYGLVIMGGGR